MRWKSRCRWGYSPSVIDLRDFWTRLPSSARAGMFLSMLAVTWIALGQTWFFVGPSEWDDVLYFEIASVPSPMAELRNRYVHIWLLRIFEQIFTPRALAAGLYANVLVVLLAMVCFAFGRAAAGTACGIIAALMMPIDVSVLKWISAPYVDPCLALWSGCAILAATLAFERDQSRIRIGWLLFAGVGSYLAIKSKETGLAILPVVALIIMQHAKQWQSSMVWLGGFVIGWLALVGLDGLFTDATWPWRSADWGIYFGAETLQPRRSPLSSSVRFDAHYLQQVVRAGHLTVTLLAIAGVIRGFKSNAFVRSAALWWGASVGFGSLMAFLRPGLFADERYLASFAPAMVVLAAYEAVCLYRGAEERDWKEILIAIAIIVGVTWLPFMHLTLDLVGRETDRTPRALFYLFPVAIVVLFTILKIARARYVVIAALVALGALTVASNVSESRKHVLEARARMEPWKRLSVLMDRANVQLVRWRLPKKPFATYRVRRRLRTWSRRPAKIINVMNVKELPSATDRAWVFALGRHDKRFDKLGWIHVIEGFDHDGWWSVYRPPL